MGELSHNQVSFAAGLWSPKLDARVDQQKYGSAARQFLNVISYKGGGFTRAPGTQMVVPTKLTNTSGHSYVSRLMPFTFSPSVTFQLEFGHNYVRFYTGGTTATQVTVSSAPQWITGTTYSAGAFVEDPGATPANTIYYCILGLTSSTQPHLDATHWVAQTIYEVPSPYTADSFGGAASNTQVFQVVPCQINDVIYLVHPDVQPYSLTRFGNTDWVMEPVKYISPALLDQNATNTIITPSALQGNGITLTASAPGWFTAISYQIGDSVIQNATGSNILYNCIVAHVSGTFLTDLAAGDWEAVGIFNPDHVGSTWQLSTLRPSAYIEYDGTAAGGFGQGTSTQIQCLGPYEVHTYGVWSANIAVQRSLDGGQTFDTVQSVTGRSDRNVDLKGTAAQLGIYQIVVSNVATPINPGATNPRVVFEVEDAFLSGLVEIISVTEINASAMVNATTYEIWTLGTVNWGALGAGADFGVGTIFTYNGTAVTGTGGVVFNPYSATANVITQLTDSKPMPAQWVSGTAYKFHVAATGIVAGLTYVIVTVGSTDFTVIGASANVVGTVFTATAVGTGTGTATSMVQYAFVSYTATADVTSTTPPNQDSSHWAATAPGGTEYWSEAAWSNFRGFPQAITSFQQRVIYASSGFEPQRIWGTVTNDLENFALGDQTLATDGFAFDLNAPSRGPILWLTSQNDLFAGFSGAEWVINSGSTATTGGNSGAAITATNINAFEQGTFGSAPFVQPAIVGNAVFFAQRQADAVRQMLFSVYTAKYMSQDLTTLADNLFPSGIVQLAYQSRWRHQGIVWIVTQQGSICGLTYDLDQEVFGWCERTTGIGQVDSNGNAILPDNGFESISVIDGQGNSDDELWMVSNRLINGLQTRFIERMNPANWEETFIQPPTPPGPVLANAYYVDCGITVASPGSLTITGLSYLNGRSVVGLADGVAFGPLTVSGGNVILPPTFTSPVAVVQVGLPIQYKVQAMRIDMDAKAGNTQGLKKQVSDVYLRLFNSCGGYISNGSTATQTWVSAMSYGIGQIVISPLTKTAYQCVVVTAGTTDPSQSTDWAATPEPIFRPAVPIKYTPSQSLPFGVPVFATGPADFRITPMLNTFLDTDPNIIVTGNDALPITVLGMTLKYGLVSVP